MNEQWLVMKEDLGSKGSLKGILQMTAFKLREVKISPVVTQLTNGKNCLCTQISVSVMDGAGDSSDSLVEQDIHPQPAPSDAPFS